MGSVSREYLEEGFYNNIVPRTPVPSAASVNFGIGLTMVLVGCVMLGIAAAILCLSKPVLYSRDGRYDQLLMSVVPIDPRKRWMLQLSNPPNLKT